MSTGDKKDWNEFNCSQEHEFTYVKNSVLYFKKVKNELFNNHSSTIF